MTEEEAKTKFCCGPLHSEGALEKCQGSACMAWRWEMERVSCGDGYRRDVPSKTHGHCGLAGKP